MWPAEPKELPTPDIEEKRALEYFIGPWETIQILRHLIKLQKWLTKTYLGISVPLTKS
jgi:hypothetical protein